MAEPGELILAHEGETLDCGRRLAEALLHVRPRALVVHLEGDLGAGKTTFVRGLLRTLGHEGRVPSPTYTLVEPYALAGYRVCHVDLYRVRESREVADLALAEQMGEGTLALIEWPDHGVGQLGEADLLLRFRWLPGGRALHAEAGTLVGGLVLARFLGNERATEARP